MSRWFTIFYLIIEIIAFIALGEWIGYGWAILLVLGLFIVGLAFAAFEFKRIYQQLLVSTSRTLTEYGEKAPEEALKRSAKGAGHFVADSAILLVGCWLIALPGVISTAIGFLMVLPPVRWLIRKTGSATVLNWFRRMGDQSMMVVTQYGTRPSSPGGPGSSGFEGFLGFPGFPGASGASGTSGASGASGRNTAPGTAEDIRNFPQDRIVPPAPDNAWDDDHGGRGSNGTGGSDGTGGAGGTNDSGDGTDTK